MKLNLDQGNVRFAINQFEDGRVRIAERWYTESVIVLPERLIHPWPAPRLDHLSAADFLEIQDEIVVLLLGTGRRQRFPDPRLFAELASSGIGVEVMDTAAACRTYNVLVAEGREVAAALYLGTHAE